MGAAAVLRLASEGVRCAIGYTADDAAAEETATAASKLGPMPVLVKGDVATDGEAMVARASEGLDGIDSMIVTAYPHILGRALAVTREEYERAFGIHYWGTLCAIRAAAATLERAQGAIVAVSSVGTHRYAKYYGALGPAKSAMETLVQYVAAELGPRGVRANAVRPQLVVSDEDVDAGEAMGGAPRSDDIGGYDKVYAEVARRTPLRRLARPADIANVCVALLSSDFGYVTGQIFDVDGGYMLLA